MALSTNSRSALLHDVGSSRDKSTRPTIAQEQPVIGLLDLPNELLLRIFDHVASYTLQTPHPQNSPSGMRAHHTCTLEPDDDDDTEDDDESEISLLGGWEVSEDEDDLSTVRPPAPATGGQPQAYNYSLTSYQTQMMLLAQQNKKRLMAHQEQEYLRGIPVSARLLQAIRTFLGYGLNSQLLPIVRDTLFSKIRPAIIRCLHMPESRRHECWFPWFNHYFDKATSRNRGLDFEKLERSGWTRKMKYLRVDTAIVYSSSGRSDEEFHRDVEEAMDQISGIAMHFEALVGLEITIEIDYGHSVSLDMASKREAVLAAELERKLEEKRSKRRVEVTVTFKSDDVGIYK